MHEMMIKLPILDKNLVELLNRNEPNRWHMSFLGSCCNEHTVLCDLRRHARWVLCISQAYQSFVCESRGYSHTHQLCRRLLCTSEWLFAWWLWWLQCLSVAFGSKEFGACECAGNSWIFVFLCNSERSVRGKQRSLDSRRVEYRWWLYGWYLFLPTPVSSPMPPIGETKTKLRFGEGRFSFSRGLLVVLRDVVSYL